MHHAGHAVDDVRAVVDGHGLAERLAPNRDAGDQRRDTDGQQHRVRAEIVLQLRDNDRRE